ncbi:MAG TPA: hypothetical protein VNS29_11010 [Burkholderiaceae bacterium]|nr:hypothetical protein [Burkholderiaceae bacterium]
MVTVSGSLADHLARLIGMLSCGDLDPHETERIVNICIQAGDEPAETLRKHYGADAAKVAEYDPAGVMAFIVFVELEDYFAVADTVDELYEQVVDAFEQPALPDYPYDDNDFQTISDFYRWVDGQLLAHHAKYQLIGFGESYTNDFQVILVYREQAMDILSLCKELGLRAELCD